MELEDESLDCRDRHLVAVPTRISSTVQSIRLEDNNIKAIGNRNGFKFEISKNRLFFLENPNWNGTIYNFWNKGKMLSKKKVLDGLIIKIKSSDSITPQLQMKSIVWPQAGDSGSSSLTETEYKN